MRVTFTPQLMGGKQVPADLTDAINAKLTENVEMNDYRQQISNLRDYMTNLVVKLAEKGVLKAADLEDGLIGYRYGVEDE